MAADFALHPSIGSPPEIVERASWMRAHPTPPESLVWDWVRGRRIVGLKFRRQCPLGYYIADFYCHDIRLALEVDGTDHTRSDRQERDATRTQTLLADGITIIRLSAESILREPDRTHLRLIKLLTMMKPRPPPP